MTAFDILVVFFIFGMFVLGFAQGTIRRVLGLASMLFSFLLAANLRTPLGEFFASNWRQFPADYSYMIAFGLVFVAATIAFTLTIQGFYKPTPLFEKARFADELIGGFLGALQAVIFLAIVIVILDSFFQIPGVPQSDGELLYVRDLWNAIDGSRTGDIFRETILPPFFTVFGIFIPSQIEQLVLGFRS